MGPGGLRQGKVRSQEVTTSTLDTPSTSRSISPEKSAQIFTHLARFCMRVLDVMYRYDSICMSMCACDARGSQEVE